MHRLTAKISCQPTLLSVLLFQSPFAFAQSNKGARPKEVVTDQAHLTTSAAALALRAGSEADKLSAPARRLEVKLEAARIVDRAHPQDALELLDSAWKELSDSPDEKELKAALASALRSDALKLYAKLDPALTERLQKQFPACEKEAAAHATKSEDAGHEQAARARADETDKIALALAEKEPEKGAETALSALRATGKVSEELGPFLRALAKAGHETILRKTKEEIARKLSDQVSVDPTDHLVIAGRMSADPQTSARVRASLAGYLIRSLESVRAAIRESQVTKQPLQLDPGMVGYLYTT